MRTPTQSNPVPVNVKVPSRRGPTFSASLPNIDVWVAYVLVSNIKRATPNYDRSFGSPPLSYSVYRNVLAFFL